MPGLKVATLLLALYAVAWIALEGDLLRVVALAVGVTLVLVGHGVQRTMGGRRLSLPAWLALSAALGLAGGAGSGALALLFMALKTGLHAHGPEFTPMEIEWLASRITWWGAGGFFGGLGIGLLLVGLRSGRG